MSLPIRHLPVVQNWDCHVCGNCCKEYEVGLTDEEHQRISAQGWEKDPEIGDLPLFRRHGPWWDRSYRLNHRGDDSCVFLTEQGRCRIHERFGFAAKPLACRLFPFVLIPAGDHWRVGMRFACPSAAANRGRALSEHNSELKEFAKLLAEREQLPIGPGGFGLPPPPLQAGQRVAWPELLLFADTLGGLLRNRRDRLERRLRKCLALASTARQATFDKISGERLSEFLNLLASGLDSEVARDATTLGAPSWVGRILFRQALALFSRKDKGPSQGPMARNRLGLLRAAVAFARGTGRIPRLHARLPETTFERVENASAGLSAEAELVLERYYATKLLSLQFCGPAFFRYALWDGLEVLCLTFPIIVWLARMFDDLPSAEGVLKAVSIVDDHFGFNRVLATRRQRFSFRILARTGELVKLIAWYGR